MKLKGMLKYLSKTTNIAFLLLSSGCGNELSISLPVKTSTTYINTALVSTFAGMLGNPGALDDQGINAKFATPLGLGVDSRNNIYVADYANQIIRKISPTGNVLTFAGTPGVQGSLDGTGMSALFKNPSGIAVDTSDNIYVADTGNHTIRKITPGGIVSTFAGTAGIPDITETANGFMNPVGLAFDSSNNLYVANFGNHTIRKITPTGIVTTFSGIAGTGSSVNGGPGVGTHKGPSCIAIDSNDNLYVSDSLSNIIRKISVLGNITTIAGTPNTTGTTDGIGSTARFNYPNGIIVDSQNNLYVVDTGNNSVRKITSNGNVITFAGGTNGFTDGQGLEAQFNQPSGIAIDHSGYIYISDTANQTIRKVE